MSEMWRRVRWSGLVDTLAASVIARAREVRINPVRHQNVRSERLAQAGGEDAEICTEA